MISIDKSEIDNLSISNLKRIGVLFYHEYPSTIIYSDEKQTPYVLEWVDTSENNEDIYLLYKTAKTKLKDFFNETTSHREFILKSVLEYIICFEGTLENPLNVKLLTKEEIPTSYLPRDNVFFNKKNTVELEDILDFFKINLKGDSRLLKVVELLPEIRDVSSLLSKKNTSIASQIEMVKDFAEKQSTQVLNIHLKEGKDIDFGIANTFILGNVLTAFDDLYKATGLDVIEGVQRGNITSFNSKKGRELLPKISTEVFLQQAASFSLFIRPTLRTQQLSLIDDFTQTDIISERIFSLFLGDESEKFFEDLFSKYSGFVHKSFINFLQLIKDNNIDVDYNFYSPFSKRELSKEFNSEKAWRMLEMIKHFEDVVQENFDIVVRFTALNCNTGYYTCEEGNKVVYHGYFEKLIKESMHNLNFTDFYVVKIERKITKVAGRVEPKVEDLLLSCLLKEV